MVFRGGGGNTFRSIPGSPFAGISKTEVFDTTPYINAVWEYVFGYEKAFQLGRKIKVGFSSELSDNTNCGVQDLGLMATVKEEQKGFKVYGGGGLGRNGMFGLVFVPFLPAERALQAVILLNEEPLGTAAYAGWMQRSVQETRFSDVVSVRLYIRKGIFRADDLRDVVYEGIIDGIKISGCPSSCSVNQHAAIGFGGRLKRIDDQSFKGSPSILPSLLLRQAGCLHYFLLH